MPSPRRLEHRLLKILQECPLDEWEQGKVVGDLGKSAIAVLRLGEDRLSLVLSLPPSLARFAVAFETRLRTSLEPHLEGRALALVLTSDKVPTPPTPTPDSPSGGAPSGSPFGALGRSQPRREQGMSNVNTVLGIASGKGGVGKSTLSVNLAIALAQTPRPGGGRWRVGLLDADLYGPSLVPMLALDQPPRRQNEGLLIPEQRFGIQVLSMGSMVDPKQALVWRGPMIAKATKQLLEGTQWGTLDLLLLDLPPGTGDLPLSLAQSAHLDAVLLVATPQQVALYDVRKSFAMFVKLRITVLGIVENMSTFRCPQCGHESHIFGQGGTLIFADENNIPLLGRLPLSQELQESADNATPIMSLAPNQNQSQKNQSQGNQSQGNQSQDQGTARKRDTKPPSVLQEAQFLHAEGIRETFRSIATALTQQLQTSVQPRTISDNPAAKKNDNKDT